MYDGLGHHVCDRSVHQFIIVRHNLTAGEGEGAFYFVFLTSRLAKSP